MIIIRNGTLVTEEGLIRADLALDQGKIVETGTYDELIRQGGFFAELVKRQQ